MTKVEPQLQSKKSWSLKLQPAKATAFKVSLWLAELQQH
jgi:hypothetical protein